MISKGWKVYLVFTGALILWSGLSFQARTRPGESEANIDAAMHDKVLHYIRERFGVPDEVKLIMGPLQDSVSSDFYQAVITVDNGKQKREQSVLVTRDRQMLFVGALFALGPDPKTEIAQRAREAFKVPPATTLTVSPFHNSSFHDLYATTISADNGKHKQDQEFYVTKDGRFLVLATPYSLAIDPEREALHTLVTANQPSQGSRNASVTIVEFGDLQCPVCARVHEFLEKELLPKYGDKVRVVFKEFPLVYIHDWTLTATLANQCVYEMDPQAYVPFRSLVFQNQSSINTTNVRDLLLGYGEQVGVDRVRLAACVDSKAVLPRIEENQREGKALNVQSTPTLFVNGRIIVGMPSADAYYKAVDEALREAK